MAWDLVLATTTLIWIMPHNVRMRVLELLVLPDIVWTSLVLILPLMENVLPKNVQQILLLLVPGRLMVKMPVGIIATVVVRMSVLKVAKIIMVLMPVLPNVVINVTIVILPALLEA